MMTVIGVSIARETNSTMQGKSLLIRKSYEEEGTRRKEGKGRATEEESLIGQWNSKIDAFNPTWSPKTDALNPLQNYTEPWP